MTCSKSDPDSIYKCAELLRENKVVIIPTDTVYGFSGIVDKTESLIRKIKGREENKPFIILISNPEDIYTLTDDIIPKKLLSYWPGPLSIIVHDKNNADNTLCVRCPGDEWLRKLISIAESPIYSTSVNRSGFPVLTNISDIKNEFERDVSLIVENGDSISSKPSTIVKIVCDKIQVVRPGAVIIDEDSVFRDCP